MFCLSIIYESNFSSKIHLTKLVDDPFRKDKPNSDVTHVFTP